ncbi:MAG: hypothetical protein NT031_19070, partial [Planctomycetota bacterium]|nr:hypothetical protein [Planctomycetota bacterium]
CGFQSEPICAGGGMRNFTTHCGVPALCRKCKMLVAVNYFDEKPQCPDCGGNVACYDDPSLHDVSGASQRDVFSWNLDDDRQFRLPAAKYLCPKCGQKEMTFALGPCWD